MQETLDRASEGRTTIVVSHRLSAIKNADRIVFIDKGQVVEDGTHSELIASKGRYYDMVKSTHNELEHSDETPNLKDKQQNGTLRASDYNRNGSDEKFNKVEDKEGQANDSVKYLKSLKRILKLLQPDWLILTIAVLSSIVLGLTSALFSFVFSEMFGVSLKAF